MTRQAFMARRREGLRGLPAHTVADYVADDEAHFTDGEAAGPFMSPPGGPATAILGGIGFMAGAASAGAVLTIISIGLMNALVWYGRLHYRLLKPALES